MKEKAKWFYVLGVGVAGMFVSGWFAAKEFFAAEVYRYKNENDWLTRDNKYYLNRLVEKDNVIQSLKYQLENAKKA